MISACWLSRVVTCGADTRFVFDCSFNISIATVNSWNDSFPNLKSDGVEYGKVCPGGNAGPLPPTGVLGFGVPVKTPDPWSLGKGNVVGSAAPAALARSCQSNPSF